MQDADNRPQRCPRGWALPQGDLAPGHGHAGLQPLARWRLQRLHSSPFGGRHEGGRTGRPIASRRRRTPGQCPPAHLISTAPLVRKKDAHRVARPSLARVIRLRRRADPSVAERAEQSGDDESFSIGTSTPPFGATVASTRARVRPAGTPGAARRGGHNPSHLTTGGADLRAACLRAARQSGTGTASWR